MAKRKAPEEEPADVPKRSRRGEQPKPSPAKAAGKASKQVDSTKGAPKNVKQAAKPSKASASQKATAKPNPKGEREEREGIKYWLFKSEPDEYGIDDLRKEANETGFWDGVRNLVAKNNMQRMKVGDKGFFYYSSCKVPGIVALVDVAKEAAVDQSALDPAHKYFDPKSDPAKPKWYGVELKFDRQLKRQITLTELKEHKEGALSKMSLFNSFRLSVQPVTKEEWDFILALEDEEK